MEDIHEIRAGDLVIRKSSEQVFLVLEVKIVSSKEEVTLIRIFPYFPSWHFAFKYARVNFDV